MSAMSVKFYYVSVVKLGISFEVHFMDKTFTICDTNPEFLCVASSSSLWNFRSGCWIKFITIFSEIVICVAKSSQSTTTIAMKFNNIKYNSVIYKNIKYLFSLCRGQYKSLSYVQGQEPEPKVREYFYYIDHQGMLFLDDSKMKNFTSCFKEKKFLEFFFKRIRLNTTGRYTDEFPYVSLCGRERNYIRCDDLPIVYTHIITKNNSDILTYGYAGDLLSTKFIPQQIYMLRLTGRVYHPAADKYGGIGLIKSKLAIELSKSFEFQNGEGQPPTHFVWKDNKYELDQDWFEKKITQFNLKINTTISE